MAPGASTASAQQSAPQLERCSRNRLRGAGGRPRAAWRLAFLARQASPRAPGPVATSWSDAQVEDVVSGVRTPRDLSELRDWMPAAHAQLLEIMRTLERHYGDMQDTEFTIEEGRLYMLQTRNAKRPAQAADPLRGRRRRRGPAHDASRRSRRSTRGALRRAAAPHLRPRRALRGRSPAASPPRRARPRARSSSPPHDAVAAAEDGRAVILVRPFTEADDVAGFHAAKGILTSEGGKASHAALVARGMGCPAVTGADALEIDLHAREVRIGERVLHEGDLIAIDGTAGTITLDDVAARRPPRSTRASTRCCSGATSCARSACAPTPTRPTDARRARAFGAEGVGLCRTEHMFMASERAPLMRAMIMAADEARAAGGAGQAAAAAAGRLRRDSSRRWRGWR